MRYYVSGCAGFIGSNVCRSLLDAGYEVVGQDCLTDYYDRDLKSRRLSFAREGFTFFTQDINHHIDLTGVDTVIHLAGQPGVRSSLNNSITYVSRNIAATTRVLDTAMRSSVRRVVYASSSSVYGLDSIYAATKAACELIADQYASQFDAVIGCRIFPTYGPIGRPDMAPWKIASSVLRGEPVLITGDGSQRRDYTYIDDTVAEIIRLASEGSTGIHDVGRRRLRSVNELVECIEQATGLTADRRCVAKPAEETDDLVASRSCGSWEIEDGIPLMVASVREWHKRERRAA